LGAITNKIIYVIAQSAEASLNMFGGDNADLDTGHSLFEHRDHHVDRCHHLFR
jgi:hypothetical protein